MNQRARLEESEEKDENALESGDLPRPVAGERLGETMQALKVYIFASRGARSSGRCWNAAGVPGLRVTLGRGTAR
jgi:hypothetical protein